MITVLRLAVLLFPLSSYAADVRLPSSTSRSGTAAALSAAALLPPAQDLAPSLPEDSALSAADAEGSRNLQSDFARNAELIQRELGLEFEPTEEGRGDNLWYRTLGAPAPYDPQGSISPMMIAKIRLRQAVSDIYIPEQVPEAARQDLAQEPNLEHLRALAYLLLRKAAQVSAQTLKATYTQNLWLLPLRLETGGLDPRPHDLVDHILTFAPRSKQGSLLATLQELGAALRAPDGSWRSNPYGENVAMIFAASGHILEDPIDSWAETSTQRKLVHYLARHPRTTQQIPVEYWDCEARLLVTPLIEMLRSGTLFPSAPLRGKKNPSSEDFKYAFGYRPHDNDKADLANPVFNMRRRLFGFAEAAGLKLPAHGASEELLDPELRYHLLARLHTYVFDQVLKALKDLSPEGERALPRVLDALNEWDLSGMVDRYQRTLIVHLVHWASDKGKECLRGRQNGDNLCPVCPKQARVIKILKYKKQMLWKIMEYEDDLGKTALAYASMPSSWCRCEGEEEFDLEAHLSMFLEQGAPGRNPYSDPAHLDPLILQPASSAYNNHGEECNPLFDDSALDSDAR